MVSVARLFVVLAMFAVMGLTSSVAFAQPFDRTYLASNGNETATCGPLNEPCRSFGFAIAHTKAGGEVTCLAAVGQTSGFTVDRAITIDCANVLDVLATTLSQSGQIIVSAGATDRVTIRGFRVHPSSAVDGLLVNQVGVLTLDQMRFVGSNANGILFSPTNGGAKLVVNNTVISHGGSSSAGAGIRIFPTSGGTAQVTLNQVLVSGSTFGLAIDGTGSTGGINATVVDSVFTSNTNDGLIAVSSPGTAPVGLTVSDSTSSNNGFGVRSISANATVRLNSSRVIGNGVGLSFSGGGALLTFGNNNVEANGTNGTFSAPVAFK